MPLVNAVGKAALNFQISVTIYFAAAMVTCLIAIGVALAPAVFLFGVICSIIGAVKASEGEVFNYPLSIKFIK